MLKIVRETAKIFSLLQSQGKCYIMPATNNKILQNNIHYNFVNVLITSKYYHYQLPNNVDQTIFLIQKQPKLNEKTVLLQHLTDLVTSNPANTLSHHQTQKVVKQLQLWKDRTGYKDKVATVAWIISKLQLKQCHPLYLQIANRFQNDEWYPNLDESIKALQAFVYLEEGPLKQYIYPRIEKNISKCIWQQNMLAYKRVVSALLSSNRTNSPLWDKLQQYIMRNLGMDYSLKTITDIFTSYALARRGSDVFYQMLQKTIYLGHWYNYELKHKILPGYDQKGQFYALLVQTYAIAKTNHQITLLPNFLQYIYNGVADRQTNYQNLGSFTKLVKFLPGLFQPQDQEQILFNLLQHKKPHNVNFLQIVDFYHTLNSRSIDIPKKLHRFIEKQLINDIRRQLVPPVATLQLCEQLVQNGYVLDQKQLWKAVEQSLVNRYKYLQGQQAEQVFKLAQKSKYLPNNTKKQLALPL